MLAVYPEIQEKVVAELHEIFDDADSPVTYEDLSKLTYLEMVVKESLRHFPVGPFIARKTSDDFPFKGKFDILISSFENILCEQIFQMTKNLFSIFVKVASYPKVHSSF